MFVVGAIPAMIGKLVHIIPMYVAKSFTKAIVSVKEFNLVVLFVTRIVTIFFTHLLLYVVFLLLGLEQPFFIVCALGLLGIYASYYFRELSSVVDYFRLSNKKEALRNDYFRITNQFL